MVHTANNRNNGPENPYEISTNTRDKASADGTLAGKISNEMYMQKINRLRKWNKGYAWANAGLTE
ncbi:hypothetical protein DYBT9275_03610 [Dyadobacter sp. CECT 9275]|uniref:Uncharacterized protein n=1 Tax=Dyadobacter helix TaxID=2822344 RepID=A0A916ND28_9BACT|nr:hypothetical protein DYBT9275_03610 [Dyadobacter sp. CECT 9275]